MNTMYLEKYNEIKQLIKKFKLKHYFDYFDSQNLFYLMDKKNHNVTHFYNMDQRGLELKLYFNDSGLNFLHDSFSGDDDYLDQTFACDMTVIRLVCKSALLPPDYYHLRKDGIRINAQNNLLLYQYKEGYGFKSIRLKEMDRILDFLYYLSSLIENELEDLQKAFSENKMVVAFFNRDEFLYQIQYTNVFSFERFPRKSKANMAFIQDNRLLTMVEDTCYLIQSFVLPEQKGHKPFPILLLMYSSKTKEYSHQVIHCNPAHIQDYVGAFLDDYFKEHGIPTEIITNHRRIFSRIYNTMKELGVILSFQKKNNEVGDVLYDLYEESLGQADMKHIFTKFSKWFVS